LQPPFFPVDGIKRFLDQMALLKLNVFHWHLTDVQGWRIEIKRYPRLTDVGAWRDESPMRGAPERGDGRRYSTGGNRHALVFWRTPCPRRRTAASGLAVSSPAAEGGS